VSAATAQRRLVAELVRGLEAGGGTATRVLETHISYVLLTGKHAYKIKKAVEFSFLDFRTLEARRFFCEQELKLNRRLASRSTRRRADHGNRTPRCWR
jgi:aminoglycoside phosphotransferase family enzyme